MTIWQRIKNLWLLSNFKITPNSRGGVDIFLNNEEKTFDFKEKPRMAQIIRRNTPVESFMEKTKENGI